MLSYGLNTSTAQSVEWTNPALDVLYIGVENVLPLKVVGVAPAEVGLFVSNGYLKQDRGGHYLWSSNSVGKEEELIAILGDKVIARFKRKFVHVPSPKAQQVPLNATVKNLEAVTCVLPNFKLEVSTEISRYTIQITLKNGGNIISLENKGSQLTAANHRELQYVGEEDQVLITQIYGRLPGDQANRRLNDIKLQ